MKTKMPSSIRKFATRILPSFSLAASLFFSAAPALRAQGMGAGQQNDKSVPPSQVERKNRAPVSKDLVKVKFPRPYETKLPNGVSVLILEDHRLPTVNVSMQIFGSGGLYEPADKRGIASLTATMLREGTKTRSSKQFAQDADELGANVNASSALGLPTTVFNASGLSQNVDAWFGLLTDILMNPTFPADELEKLKQRQLVALRQQRTNPGFLAAERFNKAVYGDNPASVTAMTPEFVQSVTPEMLAKWRQDHYLPQNAILGISGDVHASDLVPKLTKWFAAWQQTGAKLDPPATAKAVTVGKVLLVDRPGSVQTTLQMGNISVDRRDPDYIALTVLDRIFGGSGASRLFRIIREEKGFTYNPYSRFSGTLIPGTWVAGCDCRTEVTDPAMAEFLNQIKVLRDYKIPADELEDAKRGVIAGFALQLEQPAAVLNNAITLKVYGFPADYWDTYPAKVEAITADELQRVARKYYSPEAMQIVAVGDGSKIKAVMEKYGPVEVYGTDGKPVGGAK
ncbi:MAG TPA: pitrilysin family protein [Candidatus Acidoferrum sp.]|nr:pitrilysin family protein [Candidatus Acidoferrum sp.]